MNAKKEGLKNPSFLLPIKIKYLGASPQTLQSSVWSELCFAKRSLTAASWSKHFATQNGLLSKFCYAKPPTASAVFAVFDRPVFFGVHTCAVNKRIDLNYVKLFLRNSLGRIYIPKQHLKNVV